MWEAFFVFIGKIFRSPHRVQILATAEEALAFGKSAMSTLKELQAEQQTLWAELRHGREFQAAEFQRTQESERICQEEIAAMKDRLKNLEKSRRPRKRGKIDGEVDHG